MDDCSHGLSVTEPLIFKVLKVELCAQAIFDLVSVRDLVRSQRVSWLWQGAVCNYLHRCHNLSLHYLSDVYNNYNCNPHRIIGVSPENHSLLQVCEIVEKWGSSIIEIYTTSNEHNIFYIKKYYLSFPDVVVPKCPYLQTIDIYVTSEIQLLSIKHLKYLKHIELFFVDVSTTNPDRVLCELFENIIDCESIKIGLYDNLTGSFLKSLKSVNLKSLSFSRCEFLQVPELLSAIENLRNVTKLNVEDCTKSFNEQIYLLLLEMPQLEELTLNSWHTLDEPEPIIQSISIESFSGLINLKRLEMWSNPYVNDALLNALARGCKKLEHLDISNSSIRISVDGLAALCRRSPSAVTMVHFGVPEDLVRMITLKYILDIPLYEHLAQLGCVEMTLEWFKSACCDPRGRELSLNPASGGSTAGAEGSKLNIIFYDDYFID